MSALGRVIDSLRRRLWMLRDVIADRVRGRNHRQGVFERIYAGNLWGDQESASGSGSNLDATQAVRRELPLLFQRYTIRSLLDAPCGDFLWMREIASSLDRYVGVDIVPDLIERNTNLYGSSTVSFLCADIATDPLPPADVVLCRDCFNHLPTRLIHSAVRNFRKTGSQYLLLTNDRAAGPYHDIPVGSFRQINFTRAPFSFPEPLWTLSESVSGDRQLCLFPLQALPAD